MCLGKGNDSRLSRERVEGHTAQGPTSENPEELTYTKLGVGGESKEWRKMEKNLCE